MYNYPEKLKPITPIDYIYVQDGVDGVISKRSLKYLVTMIKRELRHDVAAYGCISVPSKTNIVTAETYYYMEGEFVNPLLNYFEIKEDADGDLSLFYLDGDADFTVIGVGSFTCDTSSANVSISLFKNNEIVCPSPPFAYAKFSGESTAISLIIPVSLSYGDSVKFKVTADKSNVGVTFESFSTIIHSL